MMRCVTVLLTVAGMLASVQVQAATCEARFDVVTEADHGSLPVGTVLKGVIAYDEGSSMKMGQETMSYMSTGTIQVQAPDGSQVAGVLRAIHLVRAPHFADYVSFDAKDVKGDLGGVVLYEDPMLVTLFAPRGSLVSFELPKNTMEWQTLTRRRVFQVHTPDTMWTLPGSISNFDASCS